MRVRDSKMAGQPRSGSLWARGEAVRTFRGLAVFAVMALLGLGGYLIEQQFANPLNAEAVVLIFAAVLIASGVILAGGLVQAIRRVRQRARASARTGEILIAKPIIVERQQLGWNTGEKNLPVPRRYVDQTRIRP